MELTFDTYKKKPMKYYILGAFSLIGFVLLICVQFNPAIASAFPNILAAFVFIWLLITIYGMLTRGTGTHYLKNGVLILADQTVTINTLTFSLNDLKYIEAKAGTYQGLGTRGGLSDGTNNSIKVVTNKDEVQETKFVVLSKAQRDDLAELLRSWKQQGFKIISNGIDLI